MGILCLFYIFASIEKRHTRIMLMAKNMQKTPQTNPGLRRAVVGRPPPPDTMCSNLCRDNTVDGLIGGCGGEMK